MLRVRGRTFPQKGFPRVTNVCNYTGSTPGISVLHLCVEESGELVDNVVVIGVDIDCLIDRRECFQ